MGTDELSNETYNAIIIEAEKFNHDLTLQFGVLAGYCKDEEDYIKKSIQLIEEMQSYDKFDLDDLFFGNPPKKEDFRIALLNILEKIKQLEKIPMDQRTYFYD